MSEPDYTHALQSAPKPEPVRVPPTDSALGERSSKFRVFTYGEHAAELEACSAAYVLMRAIQAFENVGFGSHVTQPLRDALQSVEYSLREIRS